MSAIDEVAASVVVGAGPAGPAGHFFVAPTGMLREIGLEARRIAEAIARRQRSG